MLPWLRSSSIKRNLQNQTNGIYLTFDDGPTEAATVKINQLLLGKNISATFFVIGEKAKRNSVQIYQMQKDGHRIFSHSSDHNYRYFFSSKSVLKKWVLNSIDEIQQLTGQPSWGFRPPAGVLTPALIEIAEEEDLPLYLWNHRFYDTQRKWTPLQAKKSIAQMASGDIVLLHDRQKEKNLELFLTTLEFYIQELKAKNFQFATIK